MQPQEEAKPGLFPPVGDGTDSSGMRASHTLCGHCVRQTSSTIVLYFYFLEKQTMRPVKGEVVSDLVECNANIYCKHQSVRKSAGPLYVLGGGI